MREIDTGLIRDTVEKMCIDAAVEIHADILGCYRYFLEREKSPAGREVLKQLIENASIAEREGIPSCQDTGMTVVFLDFGTEVRLTGEPVSDAVNEGVRRGYEKGVLRKSVVMHPLDRQNTDDNTPAVIHYDLVPGDRIRIAVMPKGFGSENMSALGMLKPSDGEGGVVDFIVRTIENAGPNACPPLFVGVGLGGTAEKAMLLAKKSLLRKPGVRSCSPHDARIEEEVIKKANGLGIGPGGLGGTVTVFDVFVESYPTHIAGLPVAVNLCCHALRHREAVL